jgi:hypothetical protein
LEDPAITLVNVDRFVIAYNGNREKHFLYEVRVDKTDILDDQQPTDIKVALLIIHSQV